MHRVLGIPEVIFNIFCFLPSSVTLAALARTCRTFKEPALDILWSELNDPSPLSRCLPEISHGIITERNTYSSTTLYSFTRPLKQAEWDILRSYARRVWCIYDYEFCARRLDWKFLRATMDLTPATSLFPNLRSLLCELTEEFLPFLHLPLPSLIRLDIKLPSGHVDLSVLQDSFKLLACTSTKLKRLDIGDFDNELESSNIVSNSIRGWSNLEMVTCPGIHLNVDAIIHLSRMPSMTYLTFGLGDTFLDRTAPSDLPSFTTLDCLQLHADSLAPVLRLLSWICLPAITKFTVITDSCPSKQDLASFMTSAQMTGMSHTVREFKLEQPYHADSSSELREPDAPLLDLDDLRPCMAFHRLRRMNIDLAWNVGLTDNPLLTLGSAWPLLEQFSINENWGWNRRGGITPDGLAQLLLVTCPSLTRIALAIDTRGFTTSSHRQTRATFDASSFAGPLSINIIDSPIKWKSVDAMADFFLSIVPHFHFILTYNWDGWTLEDDRSSNNHPYHDRWEAVSTRTNELIRKHWLDVVRHLLFPSKLHAEQHITIDQALTRSRRTCCLHGQEPCCTDE